MVITDYLDPTLSNDSLDYFMESIIYKIQNLATYFRKRPILREQKKDGTASFLKDEEVEIYALKDSFQL